MQASYNVFPVLILACYLVMFFWGGKMATQGAGRSVWLVGKSTGMQRLAEVGYRAAFATALLWPILLLVLPFLQSVDPLWQSESTLGLSLLGMAVTTIGAMIAFAAQMSMGASWRVGVIKGETGELVSGGLFDWSRNPTFVGHIMLLLGVAISVPSLLTLLSVLSYAASIRYQVNKEEEALLVSHGDAFVAYCERVPRWFRLSVR